jgi:hypothetical protein
MAITNNSDGFHMELDDGIMLHSTRREDLDDIMLRLQKRTTIMDGTDSLLGEIYAVTNPVEKKHYVGQAVSHRLNHGRYRPYGARKRWDSHISQAKCNSPCKPCQDLHVAIRNNGTQMTSKIVAFCLPADMDRWEQYYIAAYNSYHPYGYNLTTGGRHYKAGIQNNLNRVILPTEVPHVKREVGETSHSEETKKKIAEGLHNYLFNTEQGAQVRTNRSEAQRAKFLEKKYEVGMQFKINASNLDEYLSERKNMYTVIFERKRDGKSVEFVCGKNEKMEECKERALQFLRELVLRQST